MVVRLADANDTPALVVMGQRFHQASPYRDLFSYNPAQVARTLEFLETHGAVFVGVEDGTILGLIAVAATTHLVSGETVCGEVFWWVDPEARGCGLRLLKAAKAWGREQGATKFTVTVPPGRSEELCDRMRFQRVESGWQQELR